jgi:hypothetical protein
MPTPPNGALCILYKDSELEQRVVGVSASTLRTGVQSITLEGYGVTLSILYTTGRVEKLVLSLGARWTPLRSSSRGPDKDKPGAGRERGGAGSSGGARFRRKALEGSVGSELI